MVKSLNEIRQVRWAKLSHQCYIKYIMNEKIYNKNGNDRYAVNARWQHKAFFGSAVSFLESIGNFGI